MPVTASTIDSSASIVTVPSLIAPVIAVTAHNPEVMGQDVPIRELEARWGISRNALKSRAAALGVDLIRVSSTDTRWPAAYIDLGDQLHEHLQTGAAMRDFAGAKPVAAVTTDSTASKLARAESPEALAATIAAVLAASSLPAAATDPLRRSKALAEAADNALVLTTDELVALGVKGIDGFADCDLAYGYQWRRHSQRNRTLWTVHRAIACRDAADGTAPALAPAKGDKRVGFDVAAAITLEPVEGTGTRIFAINSLGRLS